MLMSTQLSAKAPPPTHASLTSLMQESRDPYFSSTQKNQHLEFARSHMQKKLASEFKTTPAQLNGKFRDPKMMDAMWKSPWIELQTEFYTTLHQAMLRDKWDTKLQKKKVSEYGKNIMEAMYAHLGRYSGVKEGQRYVRWVNVTETKGTKKTSYRIPQFLIAQNIPQLVKTNADVDYQEILASEANETVGNPSLSTFMKNVRTQDEWKLQDLAEKIKLNHRIYIRAVANGAKTIASIHYLTGEFTLVQAEQKVASFISNYCDGCTAKEKIDYQKAAMAYVVSTQKEFDKKYTAKSIVTTFCADLKTNGYNFPEEKKPEVFNPRAPIVARRDNLRVDQTQIMMQLEAAKFEALRKTIEQHDLGVLFLTRSVTSLNLTNLAYGTNLTCKSEKIDADIRVVKESIVEARQNVEKYINIVNDKIKKAGFDAEAVDETLEYFSQTNVSASAEAVMMFPQGMDHIISSVLNIDGDARRRKNTDAVISWGGTIVGVGLTITGIGAPEGVAVLLATAAMVKGVMWGSYYIYRSHQEKVFYRELLSAKKGLGKEFYLNQNLDKHYESYRELKIKAIMEYSNSAIQFAKIHKVALVATAGDINKAHSMIKKAMEHVTALSEDAVVDKVLEKIVEEATRDRS